MRLPPGLFSPKLDFLKKVTIWTSPRVALVFIFPSKTREKRGQVLQLSKASSNFGPGTLILCKLRPLPLGLAAPVSAHRSALTGKASRGNLTQPLGAAFHVVCAQSLLSLSYALYDPAAEKKRSRKKKKNSASPGLAVHGWIPRENSCDKGATGGIEREFWKKPISGSVRQEVHLLTVAHARSPELKGSSVGSSRWGNVHYLCNYKLHRVRSRFSESWTWISTFSRPNTCDQN